MTSFKEADYEHEEEANEAQWSIIYKTIHQGQPIIYYCYIYVKLTSNYIHSGYE